MSKPPESDTVQNTPDQTMQLGSANLDKVVMTQDQTITTPTGSTAQAEIETVYVKREDHPMPTQETLVTGSGLSEQPRYESTLVTGSGVLEGGSSSLADNVTVARGGGVTSPVGAPTKMVQSQDGSMAIGEMFHGKYEIIKLLGVGGMGRVYQARHVDLDKMVAIKVLSQNMASDREAIERFKREAKATAKVTHPNAVQVLDYGVEEGNCFLVMEYLQGESLRDRIYKRKRIPLSETVYFAEQVCYVLEVMHRKGITHRDLKPDNIFFQQQEGMEIIKVLDFGIAKVAPTATQAGSDLTREGMMIGTPRYMSPEQCQGLHVDGRSDLYSFGVVLYEMLCGTVPFDAENPFSIALKHINSPLPLLNSFAPDIPPNVCDVIHKVLAKAPADRYQSAKEFSHALCQAASVQPTVQMDMLAGSQSVDWEKIKTSENQGVTTPPQRDAVTSGSTRPIGKMGGGTLPLGAEPATRPLPAFPWVKSALLAVVVVGMSLGVLKVAGVLGPSQPSVVIPPDKKEPPKPTGPLADFVLIPGETFLMGSDPKDKSEDNPIADDEVPAHEVNVSSFYLSKYELTNAEYQEFITATGRKPPSTWNGNKVPPGEDKYPVTNVTWEDATAYCQWRSEKEKIEFHLPTEEEWEFAARGTDGRLFPWGSKWNEERTNCNKEAGKSSPLEVNSNSPKIRDDISPFGIYALAGNVCEWTGSSFQDYPNSKYKPKEGDLKCKVYRGGSFRSKQNATRTTARKWDIPTFSEVFIGFRLAATPPKDQPK